MSFKLSLLQIEEHSPIKSALGSPGSCPMCQALTRRLRSVTALNTSLIIQCFLSCSQRTAETDLATGLIFSGTGSAKTFPLNIPQSKCNKPTEWRKRLKSDTVHELNTWCTDHWQAQLPKYSRFQTLNSCSLLMNLHLNTIEIVKKRSSILCYGPT